MSNLRSASVLRLAALVLAAGCGLAGCSSTDEGDVGAAAPTSGTATGTATDAASPCATVDEQALSETTETEQTVQEPREQGGTSTCRTAFDENGMALRWDVRAAEGSFAELGESIDLPGLERERIDLDGTPAWLVQGEVSGTRLAVVALVVDGQELTAQADDAGDSSAAVTPDRLRQGALAVAELYAAG